MRDKTHYKAYIFCMTGNEKKILRKISLPEDFILLMKKGGYLLSRIALQYHRRKRA